MFRANMNKANKYSIDEWKKILQVGDLIEAENHLFETEIAILLEYRSRKVTAHTMDMYHVFNVTLQKYENWNIGMFWKYGD